MRIKAVFPAKRARPVDGIPVKDLKGLASQVERVLWFNGSDFLSEVSARDFLRRLNAMPDDCEVCIMGGPNHSKRSYPVDTGYEFRPPDNLVINTSYLY